MPRSAALGQMLASSSLTILSLVPFSKAIRPHAIPGGLEEVGADAGKEERGGLAARLSCLSASVFVHGSPSAYSCRVPLLVILGIAWVWCGRNMEERGGGRRAIIVLGSRRTEWCSPFLSEPALQSFSLCSCVHGVLAGGAEGKRTEGEAGSRC